MASNDIPSDSEGTPFDCTGETEYARQEHNAELTPQSVIPFITSTNQDLFSRIVTEFTNAERRMKSVEWDGGMDIPSINELRYVAYHLFKACQYQDDVDKQREELRRAERHCKRASFDAMELGIINQLENINRFKEDYNDYPISGVLSDYVKLMQQTEEIKKFLEASTGAENRDDYYDECENNLHSLKKIYSKLTAAREEVNKKRAQYIADQARLKKDEQRADRNEQLTKEALALAKKRLWIAIGSIILTVIMGIYTSIKNITPSNSQPSETRETPP
jgi:CHASE3 domain sensor protein